jgi:hypothetical protein
MESRDTITSFVVQKPSNQGDSEVDRLTDVPGRLLYGSFTITRYRKGLL